MKIYRTAEMTKEEIEDTGRTLLERYGLADWPSMATRNITRLSQESIRARMTAREAAGE
jgi:hypothetical protein